MGEDMSKVTLRLLIDTKTRMVLFAEAGKDFVDFLFHILSLPLATVIKLLTMKGMVGSLGDLCKSIKALSSDYMQPDVTKDSVLKPMVPVEVPLLLLKDAAPSTNKELYRCDTLKAHYSGCRDHYTDVVGVKCPGCNTTMDIPMNYVAPKASEERAPSNTITAGGYVKGLVTYMVMDNLEVKPMSTISGITLINKFNVKDVTSLVEKEVQIGLTEGVALLKASLQTKYVLTTVFL